MDIIGILALLVSIISIIFNCWKIPADKRVERAECKYIKTIIEIIEDYNQYEKLSEYNGNPITERNRLKVKILANCDILALTLMRQKKLDSTKRMMNCIMEFKESLSSRYFTELMQCNKLIVKEMSNRKAFKWLRFKPKKEIE